jgi:glucose/arabinose dehydrogenase
MRMRWKVAVSLVCVVGLVAVASAAWAATLPIGFKETVISTGLAKPTAMALTPDGRIFICEQGGRLRVIKNGALLAMPFLTVTVDSTGERGLLGVALDPAFATNQFVYVYYTVPGSPAHNRLSRFTANGDVALAGSETILLELNFLGATNHNGGAIRNPFTFAFQPMSGRMFINDVGRNTWEEVNEGLAGTNYGWPATEGATSDPRFASPIYAYQHDAGFPTGCAITGGAFYNPITEQFPSDYVGNYFFSWRRACSRESPTTPRR